MAGEPGLGDVGLIRTGGFVGALIRLATRSPVNHAFVYVGDGMIVEAKPSGACESPLSEYPPRIRWVTYPGRETGRRVVVAAALAMVGRPYGFLDIVALALAAVGLPDAWAVRRVSRSHRLICSQLAAVAWAASGVFIDRDKPAAAITPADWLVYDDGL